MYVGRLKSGPYSGGVLVIRIASSKGKFAWMIILFGLVAAVAVGPASAEPPRRCDTPIREGSGGEVTSLTVRGISCRKAAKAALYSLDRQTYDVPGWTCRRLPSRRGARARCAAAKASFTFEGLAGA